MFLRETVAAMTPAERMDRCCRAAEYCCNLWPTCRDPKFAARQGMYRTCDDIDKAKAKHDPVLIADARTAMNDYRVAFSLALGKPNCLALCGMDHHRVESHRALAYDNGWLVRQSHNPAEIPVLRRGQLVLLDDEGSFQPVGEAA